MPVLFLHLLEAESAFLRLTVRSEPADPYSEADCFAAPPAQRPYSKAPLVMTGMDTANNLDRSVALNLG